MTVRARAIEATLTYFVQECLVADLQEPGRLCPVPPHSLENLLNCCRLGRHGRFLGDLLQPEALASRPRRSLILGRNEGGHRQPTLGLLRPERDLLLNEKLALQHHEPPDHILQFANIARPTVFLEEPHRLQRDGWRTAVVLLAKAAQEVADQRRNLFPPCSQGRNGNRDHVDSKVTVRRSDEPNVRRNQLRAADAEKLRVLQHVKQLGLKAQGHLTDLIEEEGALVSKLEFAGLATMSPREGSRLVPEQLGLEQVRGQRGAVDLDERLVQATGDLMDGPRHHFLADPAFAREKHSHVGVCGPPHDVLDGAHALAAPEEEIEIVGGSIAFRDGARGQIERALVSVLRETPIYRVAERLRNDRLEEKVAGPGPDGPDGEGHIVGPGQDHEGGLGTLQPELVQEVQGPRLGVIEIHQDGLRPKTGYERERVRKTTDHYSGVADLLGAAREDVPAWEVAPDNQYCLRRHRQFRMLDLDEQRPRPGYFQGGPPHAHTRCRRRPFGGPSARRGSARRRTRRSRGPRWS